MNTGARPARRTPLILCVGLVSIALTCFTAPYSRRVPQTRATGSAPPPLLTLPSRADLNAVRLVLAFEVVVLIVALLIASRRRD